MRIAFLVNGFPLLSETFILNQITGLLDRGHDVDIFAHTRWHQAKVHDDVRRYNLLERTHHLNLDNSMLRRELPGVSRTLFLIFKNLHKNPVVLWEVLKTLRSGSIQSALKRLYPIIVFLDKGPYDVIYCHFGPNGNLAVDLKKRRAFRSRIITTFHGHDISAHIVQHGRNLYDTLFAQGDLFLTISEVFKDRLIGLGCSEEKVLVHRTGVDVMRFSDAPRSPNGTGNIRVTTIARLVEIKGVEYGIQAIGKLLTKYPGVEYRIAGDGPLKDTLEHLIRELGVGASVTLLGWQSQEEVRELLHHTDVLLAPSVTGCDGNQEGIPVVLMEALAQGIPVVTTQHSGIPELVRDGESGFLVPERDADALAEKLAYLIEHPETWSRMGIKGRSQVEQHYNINTLNDRLVEIFQQVQAGVPGRI